MTQLYMMYSLLSSQFLGKSRLHNLNTQLKTKTLNMFPINNLNRQLMTRLSRSLQHKRPSLRSDPWWRSMIRQYMKCKKLILLRPDRFQRGSLRNLLQKKKMHNFQ